MTRSTLIERYRSRLPLLTSAAANLEREVSDTLTDLRHVDRIGFRTKALEKFVEKALDRGKGYEDPLLEIEDQVAGRILVFFLADIEAVVTKLKGCFNEVESERREPQSGWEFGYESHHLVCMIPPHVLPPGWNDQDDMPKTFELQVRTLFMHAWAEPQHDLGYKGSSDIPRPVQKEWAWAAAAAWNGDQTIQRVLDWHERNPKP